MHEYPLTLTALNFLWTVIVVLATDRFALPRKVRLANLKPRSRKQHLVETLARLPVIALVFAGFFAGSWRPIYASQGAISFFVIFTACSRAKYIFIREPIVFSDLALVIDLFKYKTIFYATKFNIVFWIVALGYVFGATGTYWYFEPNILPDRYGFLWVLAGLVVAYGPWLALFYGRINRPVARWTERLLGTLNVKVNTVRFGTVGSIVFHFIIWLGKRREQIVASISESLYSIVHDLMGEHETHGAPLVIVWQSESFIDMRSFGMDIPLPNLDRMRKQATRWGRMTCVFEGGYTLRTEFAVLSGLQPEDVHIDASYPYLRASHYTDVVWPTKLKKAGWGTHFIHPYDRTFFLRHKAIPLLGFDNMTMLDAFDHDAERDGPYVSDNRLAAKVIEKIKETDPEKPGFFFVASMANHGPWEPGRIGAMTDPVEIYMELLQRADAAAGLMMDYLNTLDRPVWFAFYGDHAPLLKNFADPFPDPRTDYFIVPLGQARHHRAWPSSPHEEAPWNLLGALLEDAHINRNAPQ